ncbi:hypothetical protein [Amphritea sp. HPY]|uniref:hypothetical protein n=1 Tax=Amphritea sp. HPY TaxID=3421652 RepID=UPI003D7CE3C8
MNSTATAHSHTALISGSITLKAEMAECYAELAEQLENCNNSDAATTFLLLAQHQQQHVQELEILAADLDLSQLSPLTFNVDQESPADDINANSHYLMTPYHAVELALNVEQRTLKALHSRIDMENNPHSPHQQEHAHHIQTLRQLLSTLPQPENHWDEDLDPPNLDD